MQTLSDDEQAYLVLEWSEKTRSCSSGVYEADTQHAVNMCHLHITRTKTVTETTTGQSKQPATKFLSFQNLKT